MELTAQEVERFRAKLQLDKATGCLLWTGQKNEKGYGRFEVYRSGKVIRLRAHRLSWTLAGNTITESAPCVLHNCPSGDNPACCEPSHLWTGTVRDNNQDLADKGRARKSSSGLPQGVAIDKRGRYRCLLSIRGTHTYLGSYLTLEEAQEVIAAGIAYRRRPLPLSATAKRVIIVWACVPSRVRLGGDIAEIVRSVRGFLMSRPAGLRTAVVGLLGAGIILTSGEVRYEGGELLCIKAMSTE